MRYIELSMLFIGKMAHIWLPGLLGVIILLAIITRLKNDNRWLAKILYKISNI